MDDLNAVGLMVLIVQHLEIFVESKECLKNEDIGWREGNIYSCNNPDKTECCQKDNAFTCCEPAAETKLREQLQLFGVIALFVMILFVIYMYLKKDVQIFTSPTLKESILSVVRLKKKNNTQEENETTVSNKQPDTCQLRRERFSFRNREQFDSSSDYNELSYTDSEESSNEQATLSEENDKKMEFN